MSGAAASLRAEWLKQFRRPAVWVLLLIMVAVICGLTYGVTFLITVRVPGNVDLGGRVTATTLRQSLYPATFVQESLGGVGGGVGAAIALILGALAYGSEYGWATMKTVFTQSPSRLATLFGKVAALALVLLLYVLLTFAACAGAAAAIGAAYGALTPWPDPLVIVQGVLAAWLVLAVWAGLGVALSVLFRQSALAIGLGLIYAVVVEGLLVNLLAPLTDVRAIAPALPGANATVLVRSFGGAVRAAGSSSLVPAQQVAPEQAVLVLAAYVAAFILLTALLLRARDVT